MKKPLSLALVTVFAMTACGASGTPAMYITNCVIVRAGLSEEAVYEITKAIF